MNPPPSQTLVSVIIPCYNREQILPAALKSVLSQTLHDIEIICVDDGSTDATAAVLSQFARQDARVRVLSQNNQGSGPARNAGMDAASGKYIAFMDSDDAYPAPDVLDKLYYAAEKNRVDIAGGSLQIRHADGSISYPIGGAMDGSIFTREGVADYSDYQYDFGYYRFIFRRSLLEQNNIRFPALRRYQDPPFFVRAMHAAGKFAHIACPTYLFSANPGTKEWKTDLAVKEMLAGVADVLDFSRAKGLMRLHGYTLQHLLLLLITVADVKKDAAKMQTEVYSILQHVDRQWAENVSPTISLLTHYKSFVFRRRLYRLCIRLCSALMPSRQAKQRMRSATMDPSLWL